MPNTWYLHIPIDSGPVLANSSLCRAMLHNKDVFVDPFTFNPERFLTGENLKEINAHYSTAWGYGRRCVIATCPVLYSIIHGVLPVFRICPGRHMAASTVWITLAQILAVYDIQKSTDKDGRVIEPKMELSSFGITLSVFRSLGRPIMWRY